METWLIAVFIFEIMLMAAVPVILAFEDRVISWEDKLIRKAMKKWLGKRGCQVIDVPEDARAVVVCRIFGEEGERYDQ